jgi:hypothetical protein
MSRRVWFWRGGRGMARCERAGSGAIGHNETVAEVVQSSLNRTFKDDQFGVVRGCVLRSIPLDRERARRSVDV